MATRREFVTHMAAAAGAVTREVPVARESPKSNLSRPMLMMASRRIPHTDLVVSRMAYGCAQLAGWDSNLVSDDEVSNGTRLIHTAVENGITLFDHADLYAFGKAESVFGEVLKRSPGLREKITLQSKCGQRFPDGWRPGDPIGVDLGREHIVRSVEGSLQRLRTDRLDILLLHMPDTLMEPDDIAQAFEDLSRSGKVRYFGVSNFNAAQMQLLKRSVRQPIVVNQIRLGLSHPYPLVDGMELTLQIAKGNSADGSYLGLAGAGTLDYCRQQDIQIQAWSPLRGVLNASSNRRPELKQAAQQLMNLAKQKEATPSSIALAWLLRHPAGIVPIIGSGNPKHVVENCAADRVLLSRDEWYSLFATVANTQALACSLDPLDHQALGD